MADRLEALEARLRALGDEPIPLEVQARHLAAMAAAAAVPAPTPLARRWSAVHPLRAAAAAAVVALLGSTGLASAGALPEPAQRIAHTVLGAVGIDVPDPGTVERPDGRLAPADAHATGGTGGTVDGDDRSDEVPASSAAPGGTPDETEGIMTGPVGAGAPTTTPPGPATAPGTPPAGSDGGNSNGNGTSNGGGGGRPETPPTTSPPTTEGQVGPGGSCTGPPPWVTNPDMPKEEKDAAQADRRARCGGGPDS